MAKRWIKDCEENHTATCSRDKTWYPTRLLDLGAQRPGIEAKKRKSTTKLNTISEVDKVKLVLKKDVPHFEGNYVTLSHCWGKAKVRRLLEDDLEEFQKGIALDSLPLTFRDAIHFARRLGTKENPVNYIWIVSFLIFLFLLIPIFLVRPYLEGFSIKSHEGLVTCLGLTLHHPRK